MITELYKCFYLLTYLLTYGFECLVPVVTSDCRLLCMAHYEVYTHYLLLCSEVDSLIVTLQRGTIQGYSMADPYAKAMVPVLNRGLINFCNFKDVDHKLWTLITYRLSV